MTDTHATADSTESAAARPEQGAPSTGASGVGAAPPWLQERQAFDPRQKPPRMAAFLSAAPGLGQIYVGYYVRGLVFFASVVLLILAANTVPASIAPVFGFSAAFVWVFSIVDAGRMAALYNHALAGSGAIELPEDFEMPAMGGSIAGGALLSLFGIIALSNTAFGYRLDWLEAWWPLLPVALGAYLLVRGIMDRSR